MSTNNGLFFIYGDHLGSTTMLGTSGGGMVAGSLARYKPYGRYRGTAPTQTLTDRDFTGQRENRELGLLYYNARFYVPSIGRFASADILIPNPTDPQSFNRYSYVLNSPVRYSDPTGHVCYDPGSDAATPGNCNGGSTPLPPPPPPTTIWESSPIADPDWVQYYGHTKYSEKNPYTTTDGGQHAGLDYGKYADTAFGGSWNKETELWDFDGTYGTPARPLIPVYAGCYCEVHSTSTVNAYAPGRVNLTHADYDDYLLIYGHLQDIQVSSGSVTPDTVIGYLETSQRHVHIEVRRFSDNHFVNPFPYLSADLQVTLMTFQGNSSGTTYQAGYSSDPAQQPNGQYK